MSIEIKMGSKVTNDHGGSATVTKVMHTGTMSNSATLEVSKVEGMSEKIIEKTNKVKTISIDNGHMQQLLDFCAQDLLTKRKMIVDGREEIVSLISSYDSKNRLILFNYNIKELNKLLDLKNGELADFVSGFFYSNINKYSEILFNAIPDNLPMTSMETLQGNRVIVLLH